MKVTVTIEYDVEFPPETLGYYSDNVQALSGKPAVEAAVREDFDRDPEIFYESTTDSRIVSVKL